MASIAKDNISWPPGHGVSKGYPWDGVRTHTAYPFDKRFTAFNKVMLDDDEGETYVNIGGEKFKHGKVKELACKLLDAEMALTLAEEQIGDMISEAPFVPEEFGFEKVYDNADITQLPVKVYSSTLDPAWSMHRVLGESNDWKVLHKREDGSFDEFRVYLPCHRIAYAFFVAMGVDVEKQEEIKFSGCEVPYVDNAALKALEEAPVVSVPERGEHEVIGRLAGPDDILGAEGKFSRKKYPGTDERK